MTINLFNGMVGLSLLSGSSSSLASNSATSSASSAAVLKAQAAFKTPATVAPWTTSDSNLTPTQQLARIQAMRTIIEPQTSGDLADLPDVQTSFTAYKALASLQLLAEKAAKPITGAAERAKLNETFVKGLADLKSYLAAAPSDLLNLYFDKSTSAAKSVSIPTGPSPYQVSAKPVSDKRDDPIAGLTGNEVLSIKLSRPSGITDTVTVDLSQTSQPPTLDSVAQAINAAIQSVPVRDTAGNIVLGSDGNPKPRWFSNFSVEKSASTDGTGAWGLVLHATGSETVAIDQVGGKDTLMVATGQTALDAPATVSIMRFDSPESAASGSILGSIAGIDRQATAEAALAAKASNQAKDKSSTTVPTNTVYAPTVASGIVTDANGYSYVVGTTAGDLGANLADGNKDLYLTKLDSQGKVVWQQTLGLAAENTGAAVSIAQNGDIVVAGTVNNGQSDMLVARFKANGAEVFSTTVPRIGNENANAVVVGNDGSIYVGGSQSTGGGSASVVRLDATGKVRERLVLDSGEPNSKVNALALDQNGDLLVLWRDGSMNSTLTRVAAGDLTNQLGSVALGTADARVMAVSDSGEIAIGGATQAAITGNQINALSGGMDGFVTRIDNSFANLSTTYIGTSSDDQVDSVAYMGGSLYVGGRTGGAIGVATRIGTVDGFISRINDTTGAIENTTQFGRMTTRTEPVRISAVQGGNTVLSALGLARGTINGGEATTLTAQTSLRAGDSFSISVDGKRQYKITIDANETMQTLAKKISKVTGDTATVMATTSNGATTLNLRPKAGHSIELVTGPDGRDALSKLGMEESRLYGSPIKDKDAPAVTPGGTFGLSLSTALGLGKLTDAAYALKQIQSAVSMTQSAYRSLYWDSTKELRVTGNQGSGGTAYQKQQLANYQAALARLTA
ncbi:MAG TPA: hypothetical protein VF503_04300 [Sphingobium sp.]|uniref:hypothetical protein n=1 Tax=Sphingobium sp. TaxID=1912891 RepID=UPI002ED611DB